MKRVSFILVFLVFLSTTGFAESRDTDKVTVAVSLILKLCVGGGNTATINSNKHNQLRIESDSEQVIVEHHEAEGMIDGLNNAISGLQADQANRVRDCISPYRQEIMKLLLHPQNRVSDPPATEYLPPRTAVSLLSYNYKTNYMEEASDFGVIPTIGLNPYVNQYTPSYINGGTTITTGELGNAFRSGMSFALIDVLSGQHNSLPGAVRLAGAGDPDPYNDVAKQHWFVSQLLSITRGAYDFPMVFYCEGVMCWESYNAAKRAIIAGFKNVYWYRGGITAWFAAKNSGIPKSVLPSWCFYAKKSVERLICSNAVLAELDVKLSNAYSASLKQLPLASQNRLKRDEYEWTQLRDACGNYSDMVACVERAYQSRLSVLENY